MLSGLDQTLPLLTDAERVTHNGFEHSGRQDDRVRRDRRAVEEHHPSRAVLVLVAGERQNLAAPHTELEDEPRELLDKEGGCLGVATGSRGTPSPAVQLGESEIESESEVGVNEAMRGQFVGENRELGHIRVDKFRGCLAKRRERTPADGCFAENLRRTGLNVVTNSRVLSSNVRGQSSHSREALTKIVPMILMLPRRLFGSSDWALRDWAVPQPSRRIRCRFGQCLRRAGSRG